jgi:hypothetical protein
MGSQMVEADDDEVALTKTGLPSLPVPSINCMYVSWTLPTLLPLLALLTSLISLTSLSQLVLSILLCKRKGNEQQTAVSPRPGDAEVTFICMLL